MSSNELAPPSKRFGKHKLGLAVHSILWDEWDPIGVNDKASRWVEVDRKSGREIGPAPDDFLAGWPDDEYDNYVWGVLSLLDEGADAYKIGEYLDRITTHTIGLPWKDVDAMSARHRELADKIVSLRQKF